MTIHNRKARVTRVVLVPEGEPLFSEMATTVQIEDEAAGEFVEVSQHGAPELGTIQISPEEWPALRQAINRLVRECRPVP